MKKRNGEIDVMRFLSAVMIVVYHYCDAYGSKNFNICRQGSVAVEFFFVVTGYLMAVNASKRGKAEGSELADDTWHFVLNKIGSFYRYYIMAIFMQTVILYILVRHTGCKDIIRGVLKGIPEFTLTSLAFGLKSKSILYLSGGGWYLSVMVVGSLFLYPILRRYGDVAKKIIFPLLSMFLIGYIFNENGRLNFWDQWNGFFFLGMLRGIGEMALGASLYALAEALSKRFDWLINSEKVFPKTCLTVMKFGCYVVFFAFGKGVDLGSNFALSALLFVSLGIMLSFMNVGYTIKDSRFSKTLGKFSLGIFVFHGMFKSAAPKLIDVQPGENGKILLLAGGTIVICIVLYLVTDLLAAGFKKAMESVRKKIES